MKEKEIIKTINELEGFKKPKTQLEQYETRTGIILKIIQELKLEEIVKNKKILDLGAGTGFLGITSLLLGAKKVTFIEKDPEAIRILKKNLEKIKEKINPEQKIIIINKALEETDEEAEIAIMNPPFGTKEKKIDTFFLEYAITHSKEIITIHKAETKEYLEKKIKELKSRIEKEIITDFDLKKSMSFHKQENKKIKTIILKIKSGLY